MPLAPSRLSRPDLTLVPAALAPAQEDVEQQALMARWCPEGIDGARLVRSTEGALQAEYQGLLLSSVFHPIFAARSGTARAVEGLLRARAIGTGQAVSPSILFNRVTDKQDGIYLDRLCRFLHMHNFVRQAHAGLDLYLNLDARHLIAMRPGRYGEFFEELLAACDLAPTRLIVEVTESQFDDRERLQRITRAYAEKGYRVAIDDFGARNSNFDRLWALTPEIVKIDRELLIQAETNPRAFMVLPKLVDIIHTLGAEVVCEGIETEDQHELALSTSVDFLQGFHYRLPQAELPCEQIKVTALRAWTDAGRQG